MDVITHYSAPKPATKEMGSAASAEHRSSDAAVDESLSASAERIVDGIDMVPLSPKAMTQRSADRLLDLSNDFEWLHDDLDPLLTAGFDGASWDLERPVETTEAQTSEDLPIPAEDRIPDSVTAANQNCKEGATGRQQQTAIANHTITSDPPDLTKSQEEIERITDAAVPVSHATAFRPTNHRLCTSPKLPCTALSESDSEGLQERGLSSASPCSPSSATTPSLASPQSGSSTAQSKRISSKRKASKTLYGSDYDDGAGQRSKRRSRRLSAEEVDLPDTPSQSSGKKTCGPSRTPSNSGRPASTESGGLSAVAPGASLAITNLTLHTAGTVPELILLTAVVRNAKNTFEAGGNQAVRALLTEMLGDTKELEKLTCQPLGMGMALVTATACQPSPGSLNFASGQSMTAEPGATSTTKPSRLPLTASRQPEKIMEPFICPGDGTSGSDESEMDAALPGVNTGRKRRRTLQSRPTTKDTGPPGADVCESSDTESQDSQDDGVIERRTAAGRRRRRVGARRRRVGARPQRWDPKEDRCGLTHFESDSSTEDGLRAGDGEGGTPEVTVHRQRRPPWKAFEEDILREYAGHKSWAEIGKQLKRSPNGVSQHWRLMQQDMKGADHTGQPNRKRKRRK